MYPKMDSVAAPNQEDSSSSWQEQQGLAARFGRPNLNSSARHKTILHHSQRDPSKPGPAFNLRLSSGSENEPPSRPSQDWSQQRPHFSSDMRLNVSVELGKSAYLTCKVLELGDRTVSWLRPRENEILTVGRYTYVGDPRFTSINEANSAEWILEIKETTLSDSTSYECQVSTNPKMSVIFNLQVQAARARIKQGDYYHTAAGSNIEFTCDAIGLGPASNAQAKQQQQQLQQPQQPHETFWYFNGNLLNYNSLSLGLSSPFPSPSGATGATGAGAGAASFASSSKSIEQQPRNFSIEPDPFSGTSRFKLFNVQPNDAGNYSCKPSSAEQATIRLTVKSSVSVPCLACLAIYLLIEPGMRSFTCSRHVHKHN